VIPVTTGATGTITKSLGQYLNNVLGKQEFKEMQKTATLGTAHELRQGQNMCIQHGRAVRRASIVNTEQLRHFVHQKRVFC
jgi:hypothetical protein